MKRHLLFNSAKEALHAIQRIVMTRNLNPIFGRESGELLCTGADWKRIQTSNILEVVIRFEPKESNPWWDTYALADWNDFAESSEITETWRDRPPLL